jgi:hypothetical protein
MCSVQPARRPRPSTVRALIYPDYPILSKRESLSDTSNRRNDKTVSLELPAKQHTALDHVHAVQGQLDQVTRMLESDAYCVDVMKQVQTVQRLLAVTVDCAHTCTADAAFATRTGDDARRLCAACRLARLTLMRPRAIHLAALTSTAHSMTGATSQSASDYLLCMYVDSR